jgi:hypothetical protein
MMRLSGYLLALPLVAVMSCSVFDPRPVEYPLNVVTVDPFNFASILWNTGKQITKVEYNDIFYDTATFVFADINGNVFSRQSLIDHLQSMCQLFSMQNVSWEPDSLQDFTIADTFFADRAYYVVALDTFLIPPKSDTFSSTSSFKLLFNANKNTWNIFYWKDKYPGESIFHPLFEPSY